MKNCRTCKWAKWQQSVTGRRIFNNGAECEAPVNIDLLPASAWEAKRLLANQHRPVAEHDNRPVKCSHWEQRNSGSKNEIILLNKKEALDRFCKNYESCAGGNLENMNTEALRDYLNNDVFIILAAAASGISETDILQHAVNYFSKRNNK